MLSEEKILIQGGGGSPPGTLLFTSPSAPDLVQLRARTSLVVSLGLPASVRLR